MIVRTARRTPPPFLIVQTGTTLPALRWRHGDFAQWFRLGMRLAPDDVRVVRVDRGEALPSASAYAGVVVTGSGAMVTDRLDWSERTAAWLGDIVARDAVPVLGVCYGHQLLAHALGGRVDWNPRGREMGSKRVGCTDTAAADVLLQPVAAGFRAHTTHQQTVTQAPPGSVVLARSEQDDHQALRYGRHAWGVQFHPEFSARVMAGYIRGRADRLREEGIDALRLLRECGPAPAARAILPRFTRYARALSE